MSLSAIISMIICVGGIMGGFIYFLGQAMKHEKEKDKDKDKVNESESDNPL